MRNLSGIISGVLCVCVLGGCGGLFVPDTVAIPQKPLQTILVVDKRTKKPIPNAQVVCEIYKYKNWLRPIPLWGCGIPAKKPMGNIENHPDQDTWTFSAQPHGDGVFMFESKVKVGWTQIWFPLPLPLGWSLYRSYGCSVSASAPGHKTVWINNAAVTSEGGLIAESRNSKNPKDYFLVKENRTTIMLPKK